MIFIKFKGKISCFFPKNTQNNKDFLNLSLRSELTNLTKTYENLTDEAPENTKFYILSFDCSDLPDGEYVYCIDDNILSTGLLYLGNLHSEIVEKIYNDTLEIKEYKG